jgi:hypothetical protein
VRSRSFGFDGFALGLVVALAFAGGGCGGDDGSPDAGADASREVGVDAAPDAGVDAVTEVRIDAAPEVSVDAVAEVGVDAAPEVGVDAAPEVGAASDAASDTSADAVCGEGLLFKGDFDGDGKGDCASWKQGTWPLYFHKGLGGGMYDATAISGSIDCMRSALTYLVADFDNDGKDDIALVGGFNGTTAPAALVAGRADGMLTCSGLETTDLRFFSPTTGYPTGAVWPIAADFTGDGFKDLLIVGYDPGTVNNAAVVKWQTLFGGHKTWSGGGLTQSDFNVGRVGHVEALSAADANSDGRLDVVTKYTAIALSGATTGPITVTWYGKGDGTFAKAP